VFAGQPVARVNSGVESGWITCQVAKRQTGSY